MPPIDIRHTKAHNPSHGPVLTTIDMQTCDDSWMGRMFGTVELQLRISDRPMIEEEMDTLVD